ncbi:hypothetical protein OSTOST_02538 [Ostertagia ostertagi]
MIGTSDYVPNEEWSLVATSVLQNILSAAVRDEVHYVCCPNNYTLLNFTLYLRRRPLFYLVNLVIPTFIITLIAITGFFTTSVQKFGLLGERLPRRAVKLTKFFSYISLTRVPPHLGPKIGSKNKHKKVEERTSTIAQFAKYIFTAGTEMILLPTHRFQMHHAARRHHSEWRPRKRLHSFSDMSFDERSTRHLAKVEYDWLATVHRGVPFPALFLAAFLFVSLLQDYQVLDFLHCLSLEPSSVTRQCCTPGPSNPSPVRAFGLIPSLASVAQ